MSPSLKPKIVESLKNDDDQKVTNVFLNYEKNKKRQKIIFLFFVVDLISKILIDIHSKN